MDPGGGAGRDEPPLGIQIPDDARELDRDLLAYRRELRAERRRTRLRRLAGPIADNGAILPLLASILAVCLVAGAMLSVATFSPATAPARLQPSHSTLSSPAVTAASSRPAPRRSVTRSPAGPPRSVAARPPGTGSAARGRTPRALSRPAPG